MDAGCRTSRKEINDELDVLNRYDLLTVLGDFMRSTNLHRLPLVAMFWGTFLTLNLIF